MGLAGQNEISVGHLYNFKIKFWVAVVEIYSENGQWPAVISALAYEAEVWNDTVFLTVSCVQVTLREPLTH